MELNPRLGSIGGQALIEGVMMKSKNLVSVAIRAPDKAIHTQEIAFCSITEKHHILSLPILRGAANFFQMMSLGYTTLNLSAQIALPEEETKPSKFERWLTEKLGANLSKVISVISCLLGTMLSVVLFMLLPAAATKGLELWLNTQLNGWKNITEAMVRIVILLAYLTLISLMPDMKRVFQYHGAEHKAIFCYEAGEILTPLNAQKYKRFHPRCGTSFIFIMILIGVIFYSLPWFAWNSILARTLTKIAFFPLIAGLGYEFIRFSGKHPENGLTAFLSIPGLWLQRITTKEPTLEQLEVSIAALQSALPRQDINKISD